MVPLPPREEKKKEQGLGAHKKRCVLWQQARASPAHTRAPLVGALSHGTLAMRTGGDSRRGRRRAVPLRRRWSCSARLRTFKAEFSPTGPSRGGWRSGFEMTGAVQVLSVLYPKVPRWTISTWVSASAGGAFGPVGVAQIASQVLRLTIPTPDCNCNCKSSSSG